MQLPAPSTHVETIEAEDIQAEIVDQDEEEVLPEAPEVWMIDHLPTESEVANNNSGKDYATLKKLASSGEDEEKWVDDWESI
jgi:hypothetical protein